MFGIMSVASPIDILTPLFSVCLTAVDSFVNKNSKLFNAVEKCLKKTNEILNLCFKVVTKN